MADSLDGIIKQLERQKKVIERAVAALRDVEGTPAPATRKGGMTPAGRRRLSAALKKRWAAKRAAEGAPAASPAKAVARKGGMTEDGRRRLAEAMKRRWAAKRAASAVKKTARKKRATKKAA